MQNKRPDNFWQASARLIKYTRHWIWGIVLAIVMAIGAVILQIVTPKILGKATTEIFKGVMAGTSQLKAGIAIKSFPIDFKKIGIIILEVAVLYLLASLAQLIQQVVMSRISQKIVYQLRKDLKAKMRRLPISFYDTNSNGDIMSRAVNDMDNINTMLQSSLTQMITSFFTFFGVLIMMLTISWKLTLVALATLPLSAIVVGIIAPKSQKLFGAQQSELGTLNGKIEEDYAGQSIIKTFNRENVTIEDFEESNQKYYKASWKAQFLSSFVFPLMNLIKNLDYVFVAIIGGIQVTNGQVTLGNIQAFLQYTNMFSQPITQLASLTNTIQSTIASAERIFMILDEPEMSTELADVPFDENDKAKIHFENVNFGYVPDRQLIKNFNLSVNPGEMVAIVGPTGAGKTTIINLLERFYDIDSGSIKMDGLDTRDETRPKLRSHMAMVLQDTWLFKGTIFDNIKYGKESASEEEVYEAAKMAHADTFIRQLPDGYNTILNENASNISQGQRQLLTIARAFIANPQVLILDEATSSVDTRTEELIQDAMDRLSQGRTSFVIAHRLSTIQGANNIVVMNHGQIIETGNHNELLEKEGFYADLYNSQFAGNDLA